LGLLDAYWGVTHLDPESAPALSKLAAEIISGDES
jgi:hypothetical protein